MTASDLLARSKSALPSPGAVMSAPVRVGPQRGDKFALLTLFVFVAFEVFQGPLRYYLSKMGGVVLAYVPKGLMLVALSALVVRTLWTLRLDKAVLSAVAVFALFAAVGIYFTHSINQPFMGAFSLLPLLFGIVAEPAISRFSERLLPYTFFLWVCVAVGVGYNHFHSVPWAGFTYQLGDTEVEASRDWSYFGVERVAGFARASFEAATQLLFLGLSCSILFRKKILAVFVWATTGVLIAITTTKTTLGLFFFLTVIFPLVAPRFVSRNVKRTIGKLLPFMLAMIGILLPASTLVSKIGATFATQDSGTLFTSFGIRLAEMWPNTFAMLFKHGSVLLGRGLGGIGAAQKVFEPDIYSPGDNVYLYLYVTFGILALGLIWVFTRAIGQLRFEESPIAMLIWFLGISILMEGWTVSCIEGGTMGLVMGLVIAFSVRRTRKSRGQLPAKSAIRQAKRAQFS